MGYANSGGYEDSEDRSKLNIESELVNTNFILLRGRWVEFDTKITLVNVYAPCVVIDQVRLWEELIVLKGAGLLNWVLGGDFISVRSKSERCGCASLLKGAEKFNQFIDGCGLINIPLEGMKFTWSDSKGKKSITVWLVSFGAALWSIWLARNELVFKEKEICTKDLLFITKLQAFFWLKVTKEDLVEDLEAWWHNPIRIVDLSPVAAGDRVSWSPHGVGFVKFNFDGAAKEDAVGCGGVLRTDEGVMRAIFAGPVENQGVDFTELTSIKTTLQVFIDSNREWDDCLVTESDSKLVMNWIGEVTQRSWHWWEDLLLMDDLVRRIGKVKFFYVGRQFNTMADALAKDFMTRQNLFKAWW